MAEIAKCKKGCDGHPHVTGSPWYGKGVHVDFVSSLKGIVVDKRKVKKI